jgi:hypothetical protein
MLVNWEYVGTNHMRLSYIESIIESMDLPYGYAAEESRQQFLTEEEESDLLLTTVLAAVFTLGMFVVGHLSESIREFGQLQDGYFQKMTSEIVYYLTPNLEVFNVRGAVVHGDPVSTSHLLMSTLYGVCWTALLLIVAGAIFHRKELRG